jgi:hypothetical protein
MYMGPERDDHSEPFGMPFANREVADIVANELNQHDRGMWFYKVERNIECKRWIIVRKPDNVLLQARGDEYHARRPYGSP